MSRLLITGASGFLGQHILTSAVLTSKYEIHAVSRKTPVQSTGDVIWHEADLLHPGTGRKLIESIAPQHLVHSAWISTPGEYLDSPLNVRWLETSMEMTDAFGRCGGLRWAGIGSCLEYGAGPGPCEEDSTPIEPLSLYGNCKASCCQALFATAERLGFSAIWARVFVPCGRGDNPRRLIPSLVDALSRGREFPTSSGTQIRDFIDAEDVGRIVVSLLGTSKSGAFNVGTGRGIAVRSVVEWVADYMGQRELVRFGDRNLAPGEQQYLVADMRKTINALREVKFTQIENVLKQIIDQHAPPLTKSVF